MPTPTNRVPVRVARGNAATLNASIAELFEGEIVYAVDEKILYAVDSGILVPVAGDGVLSVNGQQGNVLLGLGDLTDVDVVGLADGDMLVYENGEWINTPATSGGTVYSIDVTGDNAISATGGPVTNSGVIALELNPTGVVPGEYNHPRITVDAQGRISSVVAETPPDQNFNDLLDVSVPAPGIGDGIVWNGVNWVNSPDVGGGVETLGELSDVDLDTTPPSDQQALIYDDLTNTWKPGTVTFEPEPVVLELGDLTNVDVPTFPFNKSILRYSSTTQKWEDGPLYLDDLNDIDTVYVNSPKNGEVLVYDESIQEWVNRPPNTVGPIELDKFTTTPDESPLHGGDRLLPDRQAWLDLGYVLGSDNEPALDGPNFLDEICQQISAEEVYYSFIDGWQAFGGLIDTIPNTRLEFNPLDSRGVIINMNLLVTQILKPGETYLNQASNVFSTYDYIDDSSNRSQMEITLFPEDISDRDVRLWRTGVCPIYLDENKEAWTIIRKEYVSVLTTSRNFAIEHWFSARGALYNKVSTPSWGFNWQTGRTEDYEHGIYFEDNELWANDPNRDRTDLSPRSDEGYGHKNWANTPNRGGYVNFVGPIEQRPPLPPIFLNDLEDVNSSAAVADDILKYDGTEWVPAQLPEAVEVPDELSDLTDVDTSNAQTGQVLTYDGSEWSPGDLPTEVDLSNESIDALSDVDTTSDAPEVGQLLQWDGSNWVPADAPQSGASSLNDLTDVNVDTPAPEDTQVLAYNQSDDEWQAANPRATAGAPTATTFPGLPGEMRYSETHFYICIAPNTWKEVELQAIGGTPDPELGDIADGGDFLNGIEGTINTILDGGNWTTGLSLDQENVEFDGGYFAPDEPQLGDAIDGGNFLDGTSNGTNFYVDGGNFTTGAPGQGNQELDGGIITPEPETPPGPDDIIDGGDFENGTPGTDFRVDGGNFTTGQAGGPDVVLDGGFFVPDPPAPGDSIDGGNWEFGFSNGSNFYLDGGNFSTGQNGTGGIADGGFWSEIILPGPDDTIDGGDFETGAGGSEYYLDGGNFTTGQSGTGGEADGGYWSEIVIPGPDETIDGGDFINGGDTGTDFFIDGGNFTTGEAGTDGTIDGGDFTEDVVFDGVDGGNFTTGAAGADREVVDGGNFTFGYVIDDSPADGGDFTIPLDGTDEGVLDGGEFEI